MPRSNNSPSGSSPRPRSRGRARASADPQRSASVEQAADRSLSQAAGTSASDSPTYDEIAEAAYQRYLRRGGGDGQDFDDWVEAERELRARRLS